MAKKENLNPVRSKSEARERGRKGGLASGEARREKRDFKERIKTLLFSDVADEKIKLQIKGGLGIDVEEHIDVVVAALYQKAISGDVQAINKLLEYGKLIDPAQIELTGELNTKPHSIIAIYEGQRLELIAEDIAGRE